MTRYLNPPEWFEDDKIVRPHILRLNGSYYLPYRFTVAMIFSRQSGLYSGALIKNLPEADPAFGPRTITLPNGRVVNNPLFTTVRLVGPRSQGRPQAPAVPRLNLRLGKKFQLKEAQTFEANVDLFNITNNASPLFFRLAANNISSANFGQFQSAVQSPVGAQLSLRYRF